ncbi:MAG: hypothetical protein HYT66_00715 [Candidatus Yanofskybacteria bacterium]|nr:hypothetical protein [Candidatus Yanofskybacteria bacterium]
MTASLHFATGAAGALFVQSCLPVKYDWNYDVGRRYLFGFLAGVLSHMVFDSVPHPEYSLYGEALMAVLCLEGVAMMAVILLGVGFRRGPVMAQLLIWGMVGAVLPDGFRFVHEYTGVVLFKWLFDMFHLWHGGLPWVYANFYVQGVIALAAVVYVRSKSA